MDILTADVELVVIVRRDCQRHGPHETVFQFARRRAIALVGPNFDVAPLARRQVEAFDDAAHAPASALRDAALEAQHAQAARLAPVIGAHAHRHGFGLLTLDDDVTRILIVNVNGQILFDSTGLDEPDGGGSASERRIHCASLHCFF